MLKYEPFRSAIKHVINPETTKLLLKKSHFLFLVKYKNEWKEHSFRRQKEQKK